MLKMVPEKTNLNFLGLRKIALVFSTISIIIALVIFFTNGLNKGIDFEGGILMEVGTPVTADISLFRSVMSDLRLGDVTVQTFGSDNDVLIRVERQPGGAPEQQAAVERVQVELNKVMEGLSYRRTEFVGPKVSGELVKAGFMSVIFAVLAVLVYIWFRFEWHFGVGAVAALIHDVLLTIGFFSLTGLEFNLSIIAAILTIVGYSLNDTVVVFDRIRENLRKHQSMELEMLLNLSLNQTLSRTIMTSVTTLLALLSLFFFGGEVLRGFTAAMIWGVFIGTYSSVFIASPVLIYLNLDKSYMALNVEEEVERIT
ncbi:MAG: protein translocase subunit SecF [Sphingomonadales bacterium]